MDAGHSASVNSSVRRTSSVFLGRRGTVDSNPPPLSPTSARSICSQANR